MKKYKQITVFLICMALLMIAFTFLGNKYPRFSLSDFFTSVLNTENVVSLTNKSRRNEGLSTLRINAKLQAAAQKRAEDMIKNQYFSHISPSAKVAWDFMDEAGYNYLFAGENLAINFSSAEDVTGGWLASVTHKENILSDKYTQVGIGVASGKFLGTNSTVVVQLFGKPLQSAASRSPAVPSKRRGKLVAGAIGTPAVKGVSVKRFITEAVNSNEARWMPSARMREIYVFPEDSFDTKRFLNMILGVVFLGGLSVLVWKNKKRANTGRNSTH